MTPFCRPTARLGAESPRCVECLPFRCEAQALAMAHSGFDATITFNDHQLAAAGVSGRETEAAEAVRGGRRTDGRGTLNWG
jgi:hypothetical protein